MARNRGVSKEKPKKDPLAVALGKRGGLARARNLTKKEHVALARKAALVRWSRTRAKGGQGDQRDAGPDDAIIKEIVRRILAVSRPDRIILFGSAATGRMNQDSDIDLLVVARVVADARRDIIRIREALAGLPFPFDIVVMSRGRFEETRAVIGGIAWPAARYGRVIYEAA